MQLEIALTGQNKIPYAVDGDVGIHSAGPPLQRNMDTDSWEGRDNHLKQSTNQHEN